MSDNRFNHYQQTARGHQAITPSDTVNLPALSVVVVLTTGNVAVVDQHNTVLLYTAVPAGYVIPVTVKRINATNTTATVGRLLS